MRTPTRRTASLAAGALALLAATLPTALAIGFADDLKQALEAHPHPHPLLTGQPVEVTAWPPPQARASACDLEVPKDRATLRIDAAQICYEREWTRVTSLSGRDPEPQRFESWFQVDDRESAHFEPTGEVGYFTECRGDNGSFKIFRDTWKACTPNEGLVTEHVRTLSLVNKVPPAGFARGLAVKRTLWEVRLEGP